MVAGSGFKYEVNMYLWNYADTETQLSEHTVLQVSLFQYATNFTTLSERSVSIYWAQSGQGVTISGPFIVGRGFFDSWQGLGILFSTGSEMQFKTCTHCHGLRELAQGPRSTGLGLGEALRRNMLYMCIFNMQNLI